ncbi:MAG: TolC family protein [Betaproteobacteria bacterium]
MGNKSIGTMLALYVLVLMSGCTSFEPRPLSPVDTTKAFEARTLDNSGLREFIQQNLKHEVAPWPPASWDLTMLTLVAFYYHPDLDVARAEWAVARAAVITAGGRPNPNLGSIFQYDANAAAGVSPWTLGLNFDIPIETAGKHGYRIARAEALSEAARLNIMNVAWQVRSRARKNLIDLHAGRQRKALFKKQFEVQERFTRMLEHRFSLGMLALPFLTDARIARDKTHLALDEATGQTAGATVRLAEGLGLPVRALEGVNFSFDFIDRLPGDFPEEEVRRLALLNRPDILSSLAEYAASQSALQLEIAKQYPDVHLGPGYLWDQGENKWSIGFSLTLPVFKRNQGPIAEAEARRQQAAARFTALQAQIINEIDRTLAGYHAARKTFETAKELLNAELTRQETLRRRLKSGEAASFTLVNSEVAHISAELSNLDALVKAQQALGLLEDALRRPLDQMEAIPLAQETNRRPVQEREP